MQMRNKHVKPRSESDDVILMRKLEFWARDLVGSQRTNPRRT